MGKQGAELRWWDHSSSSTVLLDPAALVESCKQQIQGKDGIPAEHHRLSFTCGVANQDFLSYTCKRSSRCPGAEENAVFLKELGAWEAILKDDNHNIAKLLHPLVREEEQVAAEDERKASQLSCQTATELRSMGIPCNVYYLFFDKWIPASLKPSKCCKPMSNVEIQIDKDFQAKSFQIRLFGRLNGSYLPLPFVYRMNGGEVAAQLSMLEQMAQYRQGQKTRHRLGLSTQSVGKGVEGRDVHAVADKDAPSNGFDNSEHVDDYYYTCRKGLDFTVTISKDHKLKCFVLKVIQVPATKPEQVASHVSMRCERGNLNAQHDSNKYCVSSSGAISVKCESAVSQNKAEFAESLSTKCCQFAKESSQSREGGESSGLCPLEVFGPSESSQSSMSDSGESPKNVIICSTDNVPEGLPISEEPLGKLSKKKKKKRKGKRNGKVTTEICSSLTSQRSDSRPAVSTSDGCLDSCTQPAVVEGSCRCCDTTGCSGSIDDGTDSRNQESPLTEDNVRELSTSGERGEGGLVNIFRREVECVEKSTENCCCSMMRAAMKIGHGYMTAEEIIAEIVSDQQAVALSKENSKDKIGTGRKHGEDFLPVGRDIPWSARLGTGSCELSAEFRDPHAVSANVDHAYMCTSTCLSNNVGVSQPFVGPIMVEMGIHKSSSSARSSGNSMGSQYPSRDLVGNLERVSDTKDDVDFSDARFSARGGYNGSGTGSRNSRSGSDGSGNRSHGRGSEDRKGTSGYHGGGQGSSSSNHGGGPGGSSTSGGSGGSGGGNGNRGGGRGSSGGSSDGRRSDEDGTNGSKEGDNDERYRNSFQAGSNGEASADSVSRKKGISSLDNRVNHGRKGVVGSGDQLTNGTSSSHGSLAASNSGSKEENNSWQKVQKPLADYADELTEDSVSPSQFTTGSEGTPRIHTDQKFCPPSVDMNGFLQHQVPPTKETNEDSVDIRNSGTVPGQDSLMGAWQKKISWDDQRQHSFNKYVPEGSSHVGPSKGKLYVKPTRNGVQQMRGHSPDSDVVSYTKSLSAPSTPNGSQDDFTDSRDFSKTYSMKPTDGHIYQSAAKAVTAAREHAPQARMQLLHTVVVRQPGEARSAPEETLQRSTTSKSRKPSNDQERPQVRDKILGDRERTTHWAQKWVPVEHKSGGSVKGVGVGIQSNSAGNVRTGVPADGNATESHESQQNYANSTEIISSEEDSRKDEGSSSSLSEIPASSSPSKSLRRFQTFPFGNINAILRVSTSGIDAEEPRESVTVATERSSGHPEQANLRGLLPRERILDNPPTQLATRSTADQYSTSVQSPIAGEQKSDLRLDDRSSKGGTVLVKPVLSPAEEETRRVARAILDAVQSSCKDRKVTELIVRQVGCPMAEFEKVLGAVTPSFFPFSQRCDEGEFSVCRCRVSHIPLNSIWQWYEEPSYCGAEVRAVDSQNVQQNGEEEPFLAYFVPYLSGLQIFGYSSDGDSTSSGEFGTTKGNMDAPLSSQRIDMLATLFPTPGKLDESSSTCTTCGQKESSLSDKDNRGIHLLYEFYDAEVPQVRQPLFIKLKELVEGVSSFNSYSRGDPAVLDRLCLGDVHPASWFAVAWYPIYRISEGPLRAVFLTYHSFNHFAPQRSLSCLMGGVTDVDDSISMPVVGLECYNLQGEPWLSMGGRFSQEATKVSERLPVNPTRCLENRISSLQEVAAGMAKGIPDDRSGGSADGSSSNKFRHSDYEFFVKRRR